MAKKEEQAQQQVMPGSELAIPQQAQKATIEVGELIEMAEVLDISSDAEFQKANEYRQTALRLEKEIEGAFDPIVDAAYKSHKTATTTRARYLEPVLKAKQLIAAKMAKWQTAQREKADRERREREEQLRLEAEQQREREAEALREQGEELLAQIVESTPVVVAEAKVEAPKAEGFSTRENWDFRMLDPKKLNPEFTIPNEPKIRATVKALKQDAHTIVGAGSIQIFKTDVPVNRG